MLIDLTDTRRRLLQQAKANYAAMTEQLERMAYDHPQRHLVEGVAVRLEKRIARLEGWQPSSRATLRGKRTAGRVHR